MPGRFDRAALAAELAATLGVAVPLVGANLAQMAMGVTDTIMVGYLGGAPLAAAGLGSALYFTVVVLVQGVVSAVSPLAAHALGAGDPARAGEVGAFLRAIAWGAPGFIVFAALRGFLAAARHPGAVVAVVALCLPANAALNWLLIFGHFGLPPLGIAGSGLASAINQ